MALTPILPPLEDESLFSWCARLAGFHAAMSCDDWLRIMQISRQSVMDHSDDCVNRLAGLTGLPVTRIRDCGIQRLGDRRFCHRQEPFGTFFALRKQTSYCPACLLEDTDLTGASAGHRVGRTVWTFNPVRTCPRHGIGLYRRANIGYHEQFQDMNRVAPDDAELERQARESDQRDISSLQHYVERRFAEGRGAGWLDRQQIDQAAKACEILGACRVFGAHVDLDKLTIAQWDEVGTAGFEAAQKGVVGIRQALEEIAMHSKQDRKTGGPQALYGRLYQWIQFNKTKSDPGPIRDVVRAHILDTMAIEAGMRLFGEEVKQRRHHSVVSLSKATGLHCKTLNRALIRTGVLTNGDESRTDDWASFDAKAGEALAHRIRNSISISKIPAYLNCNRMQAQMMVRQGVLPQIVPGLGKTGGVLAHVAIEDLDVFLARLRATGKAVREASAGMVDAIAAAEIARQTVTDIVRLILDGRLSRIELLSEDLRFRSVLVDPDEVRRAAEEIEDELGLPTREVAERLGIAPSGVSRLRETCDPAGRPVLAAMEVTNARGTIRYRFSEDEVARFKAHHVSLTDLSMEREMSSKAMSKWLRESNIKPIARRELLNAAIYRRADL